MVVVGFFNSFGVVSVVLVFMFEVLFVCFRFKIVGVGFIVQFIFMWVFNFFMFYMYNMNEFNWGGKIGFFFVGLGVFVFVVMFFVVLEIKGRFFFDIDYFFEFGIKVCKFYKMEFNN